MSNNDIIDIEPADASRVGSPIVRQQTPATSAAGASNGQKATAAAGAPSGHNAQSADSASSPYARYYQTTADTRQASAKRPSRLAGLIQMLAGVFCVIIGIPMLILPGPGLLAICGGLALVALGFRRLFGIRRAARTESSNNVV